MGLRWGVVLGWWLIVPAMVCAHPAEVEHIPLGQYVPVALRELGRAQSSIHLYMYLIALPGSQPRSVVHQLLDAVAAARRRGVAVTVVLDQNIDWTETGRRSRSVPTEKNAAAAAYLRERGVEVAFDDAAVYTHAKVLIVDETTALVGSTNWSEAALTRNQEGTVLVRSPALARELVAQFEGVARTGPSLSALARPAAHVSEAFLTHQLGPMVHRQDEWAFDLYLALLRDAEAQPHQPLTLEYGPLAAAMGLTQTWIPYQRYTVRQALSRLRDRHALLTFEAPRGRDLVVTLTPVPGDSSVAVPAEYWTWGWDRQLTFGGKVMYLLSQWYAARSPAPPSWFRSQEDLATRHGMSAAFIHLGLMTLRRQNLIEVESAPFNPADPSARDANRYTVNPLYDPAGLAQTLTTLEAQHGKAAVARAKGYAAVVYEDSDTQAVARLLTLEQEFGRAVVRRAAATVGAMNGSNPKKTVGYLVRVIQGMGGESSAGESPEGSGLVLPEGTERGEEF